MKCLWAVVALGFEVRTSLCGKGRTESVQFDDVIRSCSATCAMDGSVFHETPSRRLHLLVRRDGDECLRRLTVGRLRP